MPEAGRVDDQQPWPWFAAYTQEASRWFNGRDGDAAALLRCVAASPVTVLFGKSGLGKTSLLLAGLFPLLRVQRLLPVVLRRIDHAAGSAGLSAQAQLALDEAVAGAGLHWAGAPDAEPADEPVARLWELLHDRTRPLQDGAGLRWFPVFVFDQFEEVFTLATEATRAAALRELANLLENRVPPAVEHRLDLKLERVERIDVDSQPYRSLIALREDFLPDLEFWADRIPRLAANRYRLLPMTPEQALEAVQKTGGALLDAAAAGEIVAFLGRQAGIGQSAREARSVEPALLSLVCASLNAERLARQPPAATIDAHDLEARGRRIVETFFDAAFAELAPAEREAAQRWIESDLVTDGGTRRPYPQQDLAPELRPAVDVLIRNRLLRIENTEQGTQIELVHDLLAAIARQRRMSSQQRRLEAEAVKLRALSRRRLVVSIVSVLFGVVSVAALGWGYLKQEQRRATIEQSELALKTTHLAQQQLSMQGDFDPLEEAAMRALGARALGFKELNDESKAMVDLAGTVGLRQFLDRRAHVLSTHLLEGTLATAALAYSADGRRLAAGGQDGTVRLLDTRTMAESGRLDCGLGRAEKVWTLAFDGAGATLFAGYADKGDDESRRGSASVCVFDLTGAAAPQRWRLLGEAGQADVYSVAVGGPAGAEVLAVGASDGALHLWDLRDRTRRTLPRGGTGGLVAVAVSADGQRIAMGDELGRLQLLDRSRPDAAPVLLSELGSTIESLAFSGTGPSPLLYSTGDDGRLRVWDVKHGCVAQQTAVQPAKFYGLAVHPEEHLLAGAGADGSVRLFRWDTETCDAKRGAQPKAKDMELIPDGEVLAHSRSTMAVAFDTVHNRLASSEREGALRIIGPKTPGTSIAQLVAPDKTEHPLVAVRALAVRPDRSQVVAADANAVLHLWAMPAIDEALTLRADRQQPTGQGGINALAYAPAGARTLLVTAGADGNLARWDADTLAPVGAPWPASANAAAIERIAVSPDGVLVAGTAGGELSLWSVADARLLARISLPADLPPGEDRGFQALAFGGADQRWLAVSLATSDQSRVWHQVVDLRDPARPVWRRAFLDHSDLIVGIAAIGGARPRLATASKDGTLLLWSREYFEGPSLAARHRFVSRITSPARRGFTSVAASADGHFALVAGVNGLLQLWDVSRQGFLVKSHSDAGDVDAVAIAPDGDFYVTASSRQILVWPGVPRWEKMACTKLGRNMSLAQWREWISPIADYREQCPGLPRAPEDKSP